LDIAEGGEFKNYKILITSVSPAFGTNRLAAIYFSGTTAIASISIKKPGFASPATYSIEINGKLFILLITP